MKAAARGTIALALFTSSAPLAVRAELPPYRLDLLGQDFYRLALNDHGQVVGYTASRRGEGPALLWQDGVLTQLGPGEAQDINNAGRIVLRPHGDNPPAVIREPDGSLTPLNLARGWGGDFRHQYSINERAQVVGMERIGDPAPDGRAFVWDNGAVTYVDPGVSPAPAYSAAHAINNYGAAAGWWGAHTNQSGGFVWRDGAVTLLPAPAVSINDAGQVLLLSSDVWHNGEVTVLPRLPLLPITDEEQGVELRAGEINNLGQVVGHQWELYFINVEDGYGSVECAFLWDAAGGMRDLNALMGIGPGAHNQFALAQALDVNNVGQIVGYGSQGAWLLTPVPEPGVGAVIAGLCVAALSFRRPRPH